MSTKRNFNFNSGTIQSKNTINRRNPEIIEPKICSLSSSRGYFVNPLCNLIQAPECSHAKHRPDFQFDLSSTIPGNSTQNPRQHKNSKTVLTKSEDIKNLICVRRLGLLILESRIPRRRSRICSHSHSKQ